ncbi:IPTL-CTERM sorting domain-containing protein [Acanthopleuribacter pedis]|uniref:IPTL-CTERM sorting domain-containing protein n=1 Tax=Acanthopleuribacter pedis TaxID=442870 RepID=A0A8J7U4E4_9BACT|nr:IPTL-CTERM sorting domain-containing protein [Acanthopleuribacter pedis]MBO1318201.1 IPTL-CTERM sorting domain-containing protein [Acanthopleuribacter pedis]
MRTLFYGSILLLWSMAGFAQVPPEFQIDGPGGEPLADIPTRGSTVLFDTTDDSPATSGGILSQRVTDTEISPGVDWTLTAADDFVIPGTAKAWRIESILVQGNYSNGGGGPEGPAASVNIYILGDSGGLPDTTDLSGSAIYALENVTPTDVQSADFQINLPGGGVILTPGTYWLAVRTNQSFSAAGQWNWRYSNSADDLHESAYTANALISGCIDAWGARIATCAQGAEPLDDLSFRIDGDLLVAGTTVTGNNLSVSEGGGTASFEIVLDAPPTAAVDIALASDDVTEGTVAPATLSFSSANWDVPQSATVTGVDDGVADGNVAFNITTTATSGDGDFDGIAVDDVAVTNLDDESANIQVTPTTGLMTTEAGGTANFTISATTTPGGGETITIPLSSSNTNEATVPASVDLNPGNSYSAMVTVTGADDMVDDGDQPFTITTGDPTSTNGTYDALGAGDVADVTGTNTDDDTAGFTVTPNGAEPLATSETGTTNFFDVVLDSMPTADVVIGIETSDVSEGTADVSSLTFTTANWNVSQRVTVTGANDFIVDGTIDYSIITRPAASTDANYNGLDPADVTFANADEGDSAGVTVTPNATPIVTDENGTATDFFTVVLDAQPSADVMINVSSQDPQEGVADQTVLTFTNANWNQPQTVNVTGVDDMIADGNVNFSIILSDTTSTDPTWQGVPVDDVLCLNNDNDTAGVTVTPVAVTTSETGTTDTFTVQLDTFPMEDVTIALASSNTAEATVSPASLTFTSANGTTSQMVTVTGVDDAVADGNQNFTITTTATSVDTAYNGIAVADVSGVNVDDDTPSITVNPTTLTVNEAGPAGTFTISLGAAPTADVNIPITSSDPSEVTVSPATVTITTANTPATVTVTPVDDGDNEGDLSYTITVGDPTSTDANYDAFGDGDTDDVTVTITDDDTTACGTVTLNITIGGSIVANGTPGCVFSLYNANGSTNPADWTLIEGPITIPASGTITLSATGAPDTSYVAADGGNVILNPGGAPVLTVPTLGEWALIGFVLLLMGAAMAISRKQRGNA